jgi:hypothetical protein
MDCGSFRALLHCINSILCSVQFSSVHDVWMGRVGRGSTQLSPPSSQPPLYNEHAKTATIASVKATQLLLSLWLAMLTLPGGEVAALPVLLTVLAVGVAVLSASNPVAVWGVQRVHVLVATGVRAAVISPVSSTGIPSTEPSRLPRPKSFTSSFSSFCASP